MASTPSGTEGTLSGQTSSPGATVSASLSSEPCAVVEEVLTSNGQDDDDEDTQDSSEQEEEPINATTTVYTKRAKDKSSSDADTSFRKLSRPVKRNRTPSLTGNGQAKDSTGDTGSSSGHALPVVQTFPSKIGERISNPVTPRKDQRKKSIITIDVQSDAERVLREREIKYREE